MGEFGFYSSGNGAALQGFEQSSDMNGHRLYQADSACSFRARTGWGAR